jgi:hypothetical protein
VENQGTDWTFTKFVQRSKSYRDYGSDSIAGKAAFWIYIPFAWMKFKRLERKDNRAAI